MNAVVFYCYHSPPKRGLFQRRKKYCIYKLMQTSSVVVWVKLKHGNGFSIFYITWEMESWADFSLEEITQSHGSLSLGSQCSGSAVSIATKWQCLSQPLCSGETHLVLGSMHPLGMDPWEHFPLSHPGLMLQLVCSLLYSPLERERMLLKLKHCKCLVLILCLQLNSGQSLQQWPKWKRTIGFSAPSGHAWLRWTKAQAWFNPDQTVTFTQNKEHLTPSLLFFFFFNSKWLFLFAMQYGYFSFWCYWQLSLLVA